MSEQSLDSFKCRKTLKVGNKSYVYYSLKAAEKLAGSVDEDKRIRDRHTRHFAGLSRRSAASSHRPRSRSAA